MTLDDFTNLLDRCGSDPAAWPFGASNGVERLLATSAQARAEMRAMQCVDRALAATRAPEGPADFAERAMCSPQAPQAVSLAPRPLRWAMSAAVALSLGTAAGYWGNHADDPDAALSFALSTPGETADAG